LFIVRARGDIADREFRDQSAGDVGNGIVQAGIEWRQDFGDLLEHVGLLC